MKWILIDDYKETMMECYHKFKELEMVKNNINQIGDVE